MPPILSDLDGLDRAARARAGRRAWLPSRTLLARLGCPDRPPLLLSDGGLAWADPAADTLPMDLPYARPTPSGWIRAEATASGIRHVLRTYVRDGVIVLLELNVEPGRHELAAWICPTDYYAAALADERVHRWGGSRDYDVAFKRHRPRTVGLTAHPCTAEAA